MCCLMTMQNSWVLLFFTHSDSMYFTVASRTPLVSILHRLLCFLVLLLLCYYYFATCFGGMRGLTQGFFPLHDIWTDGVMAEVCGKEKTHGAAGTQNFQGIAPSRHYFLNVQPPLYCYHTGD